MAFGDGRIRRVVLLHQYGDHPHNPTHLFHIADRLLQGNGIELGLELADDRGYGYVLARVHVVVGQVTMLAGRAHHRRTTLKGQAGVDYRGVDVDLEKHRPLIRFSAANSVAFVIAVQVVQFKTDVQYVHKASYSPSKITKPPA